MGVLFKSAIGLGAVYVAMFGPGMKSSDLGATAALCANATQARIVGDETLRAKGAVLGCVVALSAETQRLTAPPPPTPAKSGALTQADLAEPWYGPGRLSRKAGKRG